jgi:hypothetical protein
MYPECIENIWNDPFILPGRIGIITDAGKLISPITKHRPLKKSALQDEVASRHPRSVQWKSWTQRTKVNRLAQFFKYSRNVDWKD